MAVGKTAVMHPAAHSLYDILRDQAKKNGAKNFLVFHGTAGMETVTFADFGRIVTVLSGWFDGRFGGARVAIVGENSAAWLTAYYSLTAGRNTAALADPNLSAEDLTGLFRRIGAKGVLLSPSYAQADALKALLPDTDFLPLTDDFLQTCFREAENAAYAPVVHGDSDPAVIHFTSGTTGEPKCVLLTHRNLVACVQGTGSIGFYDETPRSVPFLPYFHAFGRISIDYALADAREIGVVSDLKRAGEELAFYRPDIILGVPAMIPLLLSLPDLTMKRMIVAGAASSPDMLAKLRAKGVVPINAYGMSETSPTISGNPPWEQKDASVGIAPGNGMWRFRIDENGEVCVQGDTLMAEYIGDRAATDEIMRGGWLHTGDLGYIDEDGFLFLTGRCKNLIILPNGKNVSPEALENKLSAIPGVREVLVYETEQKICAEIFAVCEEKELRRGVTGVNRTLPTYERIQKLIVRTEPFPRTSSGKIRRNPAHE